MLQSDRMRQRHVKADCYHLMVECFYWKKAAEVGQYLIAIGCSLGTI